MRLEIDPFDYYSVDYAGYNEICISFFGEDVADLKVSNKYDPEAVFNSFKSNFFKAATEMTMAEYGNA